MNSISTREDRWTTVASSPPQLATVPKRVWAAVTVLDVTRVDGGAENSRVEGLAVCLASFTDGFANIE